VSSIVPEAFGRVPIEANRLGTPAVVSNRGGLPETITPSKSGLVADPYAESLAKALMQVVNIAESRKCGEIMELSLKHIDLAKIYPYLSVSFKTWFRLGRLCLPV